MRKEGGGGGSTVLGQSSNVIMSPVGFLYVINTITLTGTKIY